MTEPIISLYIREDDLANFLGALGWSGLKNYSATSLTADARTSNRYNR